MDENLPIKLEKNSKDSLEKRGLPPLSNRGAQNTLESGLVSSVDWLAVTLKNIDSVEKIYDLLGLEHSHFRECEKGGKGYLKSTRFGNIAIYYEGRSDMGIHIEMSGQGCRLFEKYSCFDWTSLFGVLLLLDINVTRLDLAVDDFEGYFKISQIKTKIKDLCVRSRFKSAIEINKTNLKDGASRGETVYFGSPTSQIQIRFYDKLLERIEAGKEMQDGCDFWQRTELQLRDDRAYMALCLIVSDGEDLGKLIAGILKNYINFLIKGTDKNKARWKVCKWWERFLGDVEKIQLTQIAPDMSIERSYQWLDKQVETTLAMMYEAFSQDMTVFFDLINKGARRLDKKHRQVIADFKNGNENITYEQFLKKIKKDYTLGK